MSAREFQVTGWRAALLWWMFLSPFVVIPFVIGFLYGRWLS